MTFKRLIVLGAVASALALTGCQDRSRGQQDVGTGTGGTGDTTGGTPQDARPGTEQGDTGASGGAVDDTGGSGSVPDPGTGGSGSVNDPGAAGDVDQGVLDERNLNRPETMDDSRDIGGSGEEAR